MPKRVLVVTETYLPYLSGVTVSTEALVRGLGARGHDVMLLAPEPSRGSGPLRAGAQGPDPEYGWLPSYQLPRPVPPGYRLPSPIPSTRTIERALAFRPEVVHVQSPFVAGLLARRIARRVGAPLVLTHHTRFSEYRHYLWPLSTLGAAMVDAFTRRFWATCDAVIAPSSDFAAEIAQALRGRSTPVIRAIPTGVDVAGIDALAAVDPRRAHDWPADAIVVASLGRLGKEKNVMTLLQAVALAAAREPRLRMLLVGGGSYEAALRARAAAPDLRGRVAFTGGLPRLEALALVKGADFFAFASQTETQGLVLTEALACGLPVVALEGPGVLDSITDGLDAIVIPKQPTRDRTAELGAAIAALALDPARRAALARAARPSALRADVDVRLATMAALYDQVAHVRLATRPAL
jgi:1,2-diacylglycerol 3-alpha-glucosyltransferase